MANNKINTKSVKNFGSKVLNAICWCAELLWKIVCIIFMALILVVLFVLIFNPVMMLIISIISPKSAAMFLYGKPTIPVFHEIMQFINGGMIARYPFWMKKHFMKARGIEYYSDKLQYRYFVEFEHNTDTIKAMSSSAVRYTFSKSCLEDKGMIARTVKLTDSEFLYLLSNSTEVLFADLFAYAEKYTPSTAMLQNIAKFALRNNQAEELLISCIKKYGLPAEMVSSLMSTSLKNDVSAALLVFGQKTFIYKHKDEKSKGLFITFLEDEKEITEEAQACLNTWQYIEYHKKGFKLNDNVVVAYLKAGNVDFCKLIFSFEKNYGLVNEEAKAIINANPELKKNYLNVLKSTKKVGTL